MNLLDNLKWRYAVKKMNGQTIPQEKLEYILDAAHLAPSSSGLQPYSIIVVSNKELREQMLPVAWGQSQITDASHILVFAAWDGYTKDKITEVFNRTTAERGLPASAMDDYRNRLWAKYSGQSVEWHQNHAAKQAYIAFGLAIAAAAEQKVDATPMEGFDAAALDELLKLKEKGLRSAVVLALGYRDEVNDWLVNLKKVRTSKEKFIIELN